MTVLELFWSRRLSLSESSRASFSKKVKDELMGQFPEARHCRISEIGILAAFFGRRGEDGAFYLDTDSEAVNTKFFTLLSKTINISEYETGAVGFTVLQKLLKKQEESLFPVSGILLQQECCRRSFLRGAFLAGGTVTDPNKSYHLEIACEHETLALQVHRVFKDFNLPAGITTRKGSFVVYIKDGTSIVDTLGIMGAPISLMELENVRIVKELRNDINRKNNFETANIKKTVDAAVSQIADIDYIDKTCGLKELPGGLYEIAKLRRKYPDASLTELGGMLSKPIGKSGVNHRLRRISGFAENLRREGHL